MIDLRRNLSKPEGQLLAVVLVVLTLAAQARALATRGQPVARAEAVTLR